MINSVKKELSSKFKMKDIGKLNYFLGVKVENIKGGYFLSQENFICKLLHEFNIDHI